MVDPYLKTDNLTAKFGYIGVKNAEGFFTKICVGIHDEGNHFMSDSPFNWKNGNFCAKNWFSYAN
jgi:hypothetical protein